MRFWVQVATFDIQLSFNAAIIFCLISPILLMGEAFTSPILTYDNCQFLLLLTTDS